MRILFYFFLICVVFSGCNPAGSGKFLSRETSVKEGVLASVNDWTLTLDQFRGILKELKESKVAQNLNIDDLKVQENLLQRMVNTEIIYQIGIERGLDKDEDIAKASPKAQRVLIIQKVIDDLMSAIVVSEPEVTEFYNQKGLTDKPLSEVKPNIIKAIKLTKLEEEVLGLANSYKDRFTVEINYAALENNKDNPVKGGNE